MPRKGQPMSEEQKEKLRTKAQLRHELSSTGTMLVTQEYLEKLFGIPLFSCPTSDDLLHELSKESWPDVTEHQADPYHKYNGDKRELDICPRCVNYSVFPECCNGVRWTCPEWQDFYHFPAN